MYVPGIHRIVHSMFRRCRASHSKHAPHLPRPASSNVLSMASYAIASTSVLNGKRRGTHQDHMSNSVYSHGRGDLQLSWLAPANFRATFVATRLYINIVVVVVVVVVIIVVVVIMIIITQKRAETSKILRASNSAPPCPVPGLMHRAASSALPGCCAKEISAPH